MIKPKLQGNDIFCFLVKMFKPNVSIGMGKQKVKYRCTLMPGCQVYMAHSRSNFLICLRKELMKLCFKTVLAVGSF